MLPAPPSPSQTPEKVLDRLQRSIKLMTRCAPVARAAQGGRKKWGEILQRRVEEEGGLEQSEPAGASMVLAILYIVHFQILKNYFFRNKNSTIPLN